MANDADLEKRTLIRVKHLGEQLRRSGTHALYIGDGDHFSTNVALNYSAAVVGFHPDLLFIENGAENQTTYDGHKQAGITNYLGDQIAAADTHARICPVDDSEISKLKLRPFTPEISRLRLSAETHDRIASRVVARISEFHREHGRMPTYAVVFGAAHFRGDHPLNLAVTEKLKEAGLQLPKACNIEIIDEKGRTVASDLERHFFAPFQYTYGVGTGVINGVSDFCNPVGTVDVSGHKYQGNSR